MTRNSKKKNSRSRKTKSGRYVMANQEKKTEKLRLIIDLVSELPREKLEDKVRQMKKSFLTMSQLVLIRADIHGKEGEDEFLEGFQKDFDENLKQIFEAAGQAFCKLGISIWWNC